MLRNNARYLLISLPQLRKTLSVSRVAACGMNLLELRCQLGGALVVPRSEVHIEQALNGWRVTRSAFEHALEEMRRFLRQAVAREKIHIGKGLRDVALRFLIERFVDGCLLLLRSGHQRSRFGRCLRGSLDAKRDWFRLPFRFGLRHGSAATPGAQPVQPVDKPLVVLIAFDQLLQKLFGPVKFAGRGVCIRKLAERIGQAKGIARRAAKIHEHSKRLDISGKLLGRGGKRLLKLLLLPRFDHRLAKFAQQTNGFGRLAAFKERFRHGVEKRTVARSAQKLLASEIGGFLNLAGLQLEIQDHIRDVTAGSRFGMTFEDRNGLFRVGSHRNRASLQQQRRGTGIHLQRPFGEFPGFFRLSAIE